MNYGIAIIGAGLIGNKRAAALKKFKNCKLIVTADIDYERAKKISAKFGGEATINWGEVLKRKDVDIVIVSTINSVLASVCIKALKNKKHILCEKPFGRNTRESNSILTLAEKNKCLVKVGFNHRFHPAIMKAKHLLDQGTIGKPIFIRSRYGHGGRVGMEKEWRLNPKLAGGGELLDQGIHIIDLCRWFGGEFNEVFGKCQTKFWKTSVEDNAFVTMKNKEVTAFFHVSTTNWGNIFSFEIFGDKGAIIIDGLGNRYGRETLKVGIKIPPFGDLKMKTIIYPDDRDISWEEEWRNFIRALNKKAKIIGDGHDGLKANELVYTIYKSSKADRVIKLGQ